MNMIKKRWIVSYKDKDGKRWSYKPMLLVSSLIKAKQLLWGSDIDVTISPTFIEIPKRRLFK